MLVIVSQRRSISSHNLVSNWSCYLSLDGGASGSALDKIVSRSDKGQEEAAGGVGKFTLRRSTCVSPAQHRRHAEDNRPRWMQSLKTPEMDLNVSDPAD